MNGIYEYELVIIDDKDLMATKERMNLLGSMGYYLAGVSGRIAIMMKVEGNWIFTYKTETQTMTNGDVDMLSLGKGVVTIDSEDTSEGMYPPENTTFSTSLPDDRPDEYLEEDEGLNV